MTALERAHDTGLNVRDETTRLSVRVIGPDEARFLRAVAELQFPPGLASEVARAACEAIGPLRPSVGRPLVTLDLADRQLEMAPDETTFADDALDPSRHGVEIRRGRTGPRLVRIGDGQVRRNGWPIPRLVPTSLDHGDVVSTPDGMFVVRLSPRSARGPVAVRSVRHLSERIPGWPEFAFVVEPSGAPLVLAIDSPTCRALVDVALDGDGGRAFDATLLGDVEHAVVSWTVHRIANAVSVHVFHGAVTFAPADDAAVESPIACVATVRVGGYSGVVQLATTVTGAKAMAAALSPHTRDARRRNPVLRAIATTVSARIPIGRITARELASIEVGDHFVCRHAPWRNDVVREIEGVVVVCDTGVAAPVRLVWDDGGLQALVAGSVTIGGTEAMNAETTATTVDPSDPFASVMDDVRVTVSVELAQRRITLAELLNVRDGSVIEFGTPLATDVALMIDGSIFARGEIVSVEGALGVRITSLGGRR